MGLKVLASGALLATALSANATVVNFGMGADDYGMLSINGVVLCTYDNISAAGGCNSSFDMQPGVWYDIAIDYKNRAGSNGMALSWDQPGPASIGYGFTGSFPGLVPKVNFRTLDAGGTNYVSGLRGDYYNLAGNLQSTVIGEGPIDAINDIYNNVVVGSWNGYGYFSLFEERLSGQIQIESEPLVLSCAPGTSVPNVLLPQVIVPLGFLPNPFIPIPKPWQIQYSALGIDFTEQSPADQGALCAAQSNVGALTVSALFTPTGQTIPIAAHSMTSVTLTVFEPNSLQPLTTCGFNPGVQGVRNNCILNGQFDASHNYLRWHSDGFNTEIWGLQPEFLSTGPLTFWVDLQGPHGISGTVSMEDIIRTVEPYIHVQLISNLPAIAVYTIIQDPGNVTLLVTDQSGRSTGIHGGTLDLQIPRSFYLPSPTYPAILLANPAADSYRIEVTGTNSGDYNLSAATANLQTSAIQQAGIGGQIIQGGTATYILDLASMPASTMLFSGVFDGGGQRPRDVNKFLTYSNPVTNQTSLPAGTTIFPLQIVYGNSIIPSSFQAVLNGVNITSSFTPAVGGGQPVSLNVRSGRNVLELSVQGHLPNRIATDNDRLVFLVP